MARGQQKIQSQQKNQEKMAKAKGASSHIGTTAAALKVVCTICRAQMPDLKTYKQHFENKHTGKDLPAELKDVQA
ncbi:hypothetical protein BV898_08725 [Hypsibius exemplaris]|uniref:Small EDRK-rich factor-like N-terminal domain-containing protein n=1 Tax=Hypsibius exemplaris TaxID=2072580 RepID=A0A1W0WPL5_HYPEX|nr:hypothetical protein BV898_08725 [Hypsibius exemplaris]